MPAKLVSTHDDFMKLVDETFVALKDLWATKGAEYSGNSNRLENFVRNATALGIEPELVLMVYAGKHWDALMTYAKDKNAGFERTYSEPIDGRWDDLMAYAMLGKAMTIARRSFNKPT